MQTNKLVQPTFLISTTVFWLIMMSLLINKEFFQLTPVQSAREIFSLEYLDYFREEYRAIYLGDDRMGFNFNSLEKIEKESEGKVYELRHQTYLSFLFLGKDREMLVKGKAHLDRQLHMRDFAVRVSSGDYWSEISGRVVKNNLDLVIEGKKGEPVRKSLALKGPVFFSESLNFIWTPSNLQIGKTGRLDIWNPLMMNFQSVTFHVKKKETIPFQGKEANVFVISLNWGGIQTRVWVSPEGVVLKEEGQTGLILKKEDAWQIFDAMRQKRAAPPDLPNLFSVPSNRPLENPQNLKHLRIIIRTPEEEKIVDLKRVDLEGFKNISWPVPVVGPKVEPHLESTPWIQAQDPAIAQKAREIVGTEKSALAASLKIMDWTHQNISPVPTMSLPNAKEILSIRKGDCNEYTALFTAMTRSLGIPTKMIAGLVYQKGRFFYHAWPEIYLGSWIGLDPTFNQAPIDVTHIPLVEGPLEEQIALVGKLGRIKLTILEAE